MEAMITYTLTSIFLVGICLMLFFECITRSEHRRLTKVLRDAQECEATILNVTAITPTLFNMANVRVTAEIKRPNENPTIIRFKYEATYPEWQRLHTGRVVTIDVNPFNPKSVLLNDSQPAHERRFSTGPHQKLAGAITE
ncbi:MAG: hypothetical protein ABIN80_03350 [Dyadobacter sp.]|uniref:hypothetical protein n=1 Tax=Dyadobacter sp. TaxID=1914288 RepID=UPI0032661316